MLDRETAFFASERWANVHAERFSKGQKQRQHSWRFRVGKKRPTTAAAATIREDGSFDMGAVTATASFRFAKWLPEWIAKTGAKLIIGKGGMSSKDYKEYFVPNGAVYLSTVGYGTGALLGRGVEKVEAVHWNAELGLAQAMWVIRCNRMGPFIVASDLDGNCLFERENAKIAQNIDKLYEGTRPATLKRYGETDNRGDEVI